MKYYNPLFLLGSPVGNKQNAAMLVRISQYASILYRYEHTIPVHMPVHSLYRYTALLESYDFLCAKQFIVLFICTSQRHILMRQFGQVLRC